MSVTTRITDDDLGRGSGQGVVLPLGLSPDDVKCPICVETISDPFVTSCGHTFCYQCLTMQLKHKNSCPSCGGYLTTDNIYPNFLLNKILHKAATAPTPGRCSLVDQVQRLIADNMAIDPPGVGSLLHAHHNPHVGCGNFHQGQGQGLGAHSHHVKGTPTATAAATTWGGCSAGAGSGRLRLRLRDIDAALEALYEAREELERRESSDALHLLLCFLEDAREHKARQLAELGQQLAFLEHDILAVTAAAAVGAAASDVTAGGDNNATLDKDVADGGHVGVVAEVAMRGDSFEALGSLAAAGAAVGAVAEALAPTASSPQPLLRGACPSSPRRTPQPQQRFAGAPSGAWLMRALPHLDSDAAEGSAMAATAAACSGLAMAADGPARSSRRLLQETTRRHAREGEVGDGKGDDMEEEQQRRVQRPAGLRAPPPRRASWCLHTITPAGGVSSVTVDTSSLHEPGQQAEAFGAAVQHALAAATAGGSGATTIAASANVSVGDGDGAKQRLQPTQDCDADMNTVGQPPLPSAAPGAPAPDSERAETSAASAAAAGEGEEPGNAAVVAAAASAAPGLESMEVEAAASGSAAAAAACGVRQRNARTGGGVHGTAAAWRGFPRCGSADNFTLSAGDVAATDATCNMVRMGGSQPSASDDVAAGGGGGGGGAGGEDGSAISGAACPLPAGATSSDHGHRDLPIDLSAVTAEAATRLGAAASSAAAATATAASCPDPSGFFKKSPSAGFKVNPRREREAQRMQIDGRKRSDDGSEDEMDIRERRRGRGRAPSGEVWQPPAGRRQPPPPSFPQQQPQHGLSAVGFPAWLPRATDLTNAGLGTGAAAATQAAAAATATAGLQSRGEDALGVGRPEAHVERAGWQKGEEGVEKDLAAVQATKRRRMLSQFELLERCYLQMRATRTRSAATGMRPLHASSMSLPADAGSAFRTTSLSPQHQHLTPLNIPGIVARPSTLTALAAPPALFGGVFPVSACAGAHPHRGPSGPNGLCNCDGDHGPASRGIHEIHNDPDLETFGAVLAAATQYSRLDLLAEIPRHGSASGGGLATGQLGGGGGGGGGLQILSSIEFDLSDNLFAIAGVVPRILVYDYQALLAGKRSPRPTTELTARSKLSCLSYSRGVRQHLLAADYMGGVALWDTEAGMQVQDYEAHERRVWGVDFCPAPSSHHCFASGSDDGLVKIWSTQQPQSCLALELRGNVCSVEWHPAQPHLLAVGSAMHCAAVYDLRQPAAPLHTLLGHRRAVSYVRWLSNCHELVTASTDSTLKLWSFSPEPQRPASAVTNTLPFTDPCGNGFGAAAATAAAAAVDRSGGAAATAAAVSNPSSSFHGAELVRTFSGHLNERNFVGLATEGDYLACGSETHEVFVYHRSLPQPALRFNIAGRMPELDRSAHPSAQPHPPHHAQPHHFVTALQWRRNSPNLLVANSAGCMWLMGLRL